MSETELNPAEKALIAAVRALRRSMVNLDKLRDGTYGGSKREARKTVASAKRLVRDTLFHCGVSL